ncbi:MAG TPA: cbb3-type cytochrome oxidase assembly protein CcoS [Novosphingobium sp.]|nr:cbb3-type cytochrome oxidase assembly protein CcoS [Novosphingobium sp.]
MTGLAFLIPVALLMGLGGLVSFFWALKSGQFDDLDGAAARILIDEEGEGAGRPEGAGAPGPQGEAGQIRR